MIKRSHLTGRSTRCSELLKTDGYLATRLRVFARSRMPTFPQLTTIAAENSASSVSSMTPPPRWRRGGDGGGEEDVCCTTKSAKTRTVSSRVPCLCFLRGCPVCRLRALIGVVVLVQTSNITLLHPGHRLVGLVVKASASRAEDPGLESRLRRDFFPGLSHTSDLKK